MDLRNDCIFKSLYFHNWMIEGSSSCFTNTFELIFSLLQSICIKGYGDLLHVKMGDILFKKYYIFSFGVVQKDATRFGTLWC